MTQTVKIDIFYPYPPEKVWTVLTNRRALAAWLMENDFEPCLGHKFQFYADSLPGLQRKIECEVIELDEPHRLVYTWREPPTVEPSLVIWTLIAVDGGTQLQLKHLESCYAAAIALPKPKLEPYRIETSGWLPYQTIPDAYYVSIALQTSTFAASLQLSQSFEWDYYLKEKLSDLLGHKELER